MLSENLPIYNIVFELSKASFSYAKNFERPSRIMVGERMVNNSLDMLSCILNANSELASERIKHLNRLKVLLEEMKTLARFCTEMKIISNKQSARFAILLGNIGKQLNGWRKSTLDKITNGINEVNKKAEQDDIDFNDFIENIEKIGQI